MPTRLLTYAGLSVTALIETVVTFASVTTVNIAAHSVPTETGIDRALVYVLALVGRTDLLVTGWTDAYEISNQIFALIFAIIGWRNAFVDICRIERNPQLIDLHT